MPQQETIFEERSGNLRIRILKTYDRTFAHETFDVMSGAADAYLWESLGIDEMYETSDIPAEDDADRRDFLWDELEESAREDGNLCSFFIVSESTNGAEQSIYVSPDWPSAEAFARGRMQLMPWVADQPEPT